MARLIPYLGSVRYVISCNVEECECMCVRTVLDSFSSELLSAEFPPGNEDIAGLPENNAQATIS